MSNKILMNVTVNGFLRFEEVEVGPSSPLSESEAADLVSRKLASYVVEEKHSKQKPKDTVSKKDQIKAPVKKSSPPAKKSSPAPSVEAPTTETKEPEETE